MGAMETRPKVLETGGHRFLAGNQTHRGGGTPPHPLEMVWEEMGESHVTRGLLVVHEGRCLTLTLIQLLLRLCL